MEYFELRRVLLLVTQDRGRIKVGTPDDTRRVSTHAINRGVGIKVGAIMEVKNQGDIATIGPSKVTIGKGRRTMKRTTLTQVRAQNPEGVQVVHG